jgi:hypothetical protein
LVDTLKLLLAIKVTGENISDNQSGILAIDLLKGKVFRLKKNLETMGTKTLFANM